MFTSAQSRTHSPKRTRSVEIASSSFLTTFSIAKCVIALGFIGVRLYALVFTATQEELRLISVRQATKHEALKYAEEIER